MAHKNNDPCIWHPYTQMKTSQPPLKVKSGRGAILELEDGRQIIDCISSWWVNIHGHGHPKISAAIYQQSLKLDHVLFAGFTHEPAEQLARKLIELLPKPLAKVFFSDNGSTSVEIALKQAYQYWRNKGENNRTTFLCFEKGYHGDTIGSMSLGSRSIFNEAFDGLMFDVKYAPFPTTQEQETQSLQLIEDILKEPHSIAAVVIEPLIQGTGGMRMCSNEFLISLRKLVSQKNSLLIYDEVMTGFGRTGDWFACTKSGAVPDIICLAKGLTGGFLPLAVTVCSDKVYEAFYSDSFSKALFHGHSYTANPLGCAAALASLELLQDNPSVFQDMEKRHRPFLNKLKELKCLQNVRCCGTIVAMDVVTNDQANYGSQLSVKLRHLSLDKGLLLRPIGNVIYIMPPYCITDQQLATVYHGIEELLT